MTKIQFLSSTTLWENEINLQSFNIFSNANFSFYYNKIDRIFKHFIIKNLYTKKMNKNYWNFDLVSLKWFSFLQKSSKNQLNRLNFSK